MKLTKETLKQLIKEELEAVMFEQGSEDPPSLPPAILKNIDPHSGLDIHKQMQEMGFEIAGGWGDKAPMHSRGKFEMNNGFIGFVDPSGKLHEYRPLNMGDYTNPDYIAKLSRKAIEMIKSAGYREGDVALPSSMR